MDLLQKLLANSHIFIDELAYSDLISIIPRHSRLKRPDLCFNLIQKLLLLELMLLCGPLLRLNLLYDLTKQPILFVSGL